MATKTALVRALSSNIPATQDGLPTYLLRVDLLPTNDSAPTLLQPSELEACKLPLNYDQGYPCFSDGRPVWSRLYHESSEQYRAFEHYLNLGETAGMRQLVEVAETLNIPMQDLSVWLIENFWIPRARAYDMFKKQAHSALRAQRAMKAEDTQFLIAERLLNKLETILGSEEFLTELKTSPKLVIEALKAASKLQLGSVGLLNSGGNTTKVDVKLQTATSNLPKAASNFIDRALADPEAAQLLQELVIRLETDGTNTKLAAGIRHAAV